MVLEMDNHQIKKVTLQLKIVNEESEGQFKIIYALLYPCLLNRKKACREIIFISAASFYGSLFKYKFSVSEE
jgi:hypothetical protein